MKTIIFFAIFWFLCVALGIWTLIRDETGTWTCVFLTAFAFESSANNLIKNLNKHGEKMYGKQSRG